MKNSFDKVLQGYQAFRDKYVHGDTSVMRSLADHGQQPQVMVIACCDSRVDPALILQCEPGDLFVVRNVANIVPPYEKDDLHHGTSAALEFGIRFLKVKHLIILGHSQCGGIQELLRSNGLYDAKNDFITNWVSLIKANTNNITSVDECAKHALHESYNNCLTFPWLKEKIQSQELELHQWFFDIKNGQIYNYDVQTKQYLLLDASSRT